MDPYQYCWMPKLVINESFDFGNDLTLATIVDDPDILRKCASSEVVHQWGDFDPIPGCSIVHLIANGASEFTGANRNGDGFKSAFCRESHPTFAKHGALYRHHINRDHSKRDGDILKTAYNEQMGRNELAVAANHEKCADWLDRLERGEKVAFSMGFDCEHDVCSICEKKSKTRRDYCQHVHKNASYPYGMNQVLPDGRRCFVDNPRGRWNDISFVGTGADMIAQDLRKIAGLDQHEVIGGAEMAERLMGPTIDFATKIAIANKLSRMEKQVPGLAYKDQIKTRITQKVADLLWAAEPARMFNELARNGAVLGFRDFFKIAVGTLYTDEFDGLVRQVEPHVHGVFGRIVEDQTWLHEVCSNSRYNPNKQAAPILSDYDASELVVNFSVDLVGYEPKVTMIEESTGEAATTVDDSTTTLPPPAKSDESIADYGILTPPSQSAVPTTQPMKTTVLFLAANPDNVTKLALDRESRAIREKIRSSDYQKALEFKTEWGVRPDDLLQYLNEYRPHIVHFSGHGSISDELVLHDQADQPKLVSKAALRALFTTLKDNVRLVVLNACYSRSQGEAIVEVIDCAVGMKSAIGDNAAIIFAASFYRGLGFGRSVKDAFNQGVTALLLEGVPEENTPELLVKDGVDASQVWLVGSKRNPK